MFDAVTGKLWKILSAIGALASAVLYVLYLRSAADSAERKADAAEARAADAEARVRQRRQAAQADKQGEKSTRRKRKRARDRGEAGKRDHFEGGW
mgnify:CR=1 FL=1